MGFIKEPEGVDFIIQSPPLTEKEKKELSEFIRERKLENQRKIHLKTSKKSIKQTV